MAASIQIKTGQVKTDSDSNEKLPITGVMLMFLFVFLDNVELLSGL